MSKTILITGGASGIGYGISQTLASQGHRVLVTDLEQQKAEQAAQKLMAQGFQAEGFALNVADQADIDLFEQKCESQSIDVLVNNAGIQHVSSLESFPVDKWHLLVEVMLTGAAMMTRAVLPEMKKNNYGRVINIGSIHGLVASKYKSAYVAAKHGLIGFSKVMALETAEHDITINTICPAYVKTPLVEQQIISQAQNHGITEEDVVNNIMLAPMPKKAFITVEEIAESVGYLMSNAARNMTGQAIVLDGGWTVQ